MADDGFTTSYRGGAALCGCGVSIPRRERSGTDRDNREITSLLYSSLPTSLRKQLDEIENEVHERPTSF